MKKPLHPTQGPAVPTTNNRGARVQVRPSAPKNCRKFKALCVSCALILVVHMLSGCSGWTINGIPAQDIIEAEPKKYAEMAAGMAASFAVHWLGHVVYLESQDIEWEQDCMHEFIQEAIPDNHMQQFGRSGFIAQLGAGTLLKFTPWSKSRFATGYYIGTAAEVITYPALTDGDLKMIRDGGGDGDMEYGLYSVWALILCHPLQLKGFQCYSITPRNRPAGTVKESLLSLCGSAL